MIYFKALRFKSGQYFVTGGTRLAIAVKEYSIWTNQDCTAQKKTWVRISNEVSKLSTIAKVIQDLIN